MSVEVNAYTTSPQTLPGTAILERVRSKGWASSLVDIESYAAVSGEPQGAVLAIAWREGSAHDPAIRKALEERNQAALNELYVADHLTSCTLTVLERSEFAEVLADPGVLREVAASRDAAALKDTLGRATFLYVTESSGGRNRDASTWQEILCLAIASIDGGVVEDPQFGIFRLVEASREVPDPQRVPWWRVVKAYARLVIGFGRSFLRM